MRDHPPGMDCELVLAMKGFASEAEARPYMEGFDEFAPTALFFPDRGFDLGVYFAVADVLRRDRYCFVNSNGRPLADDWLSKLDAALARPGVGQVGATGSWASQHSWLRYAMGLPSAYRGLMPPLPEARRQLLQMELKRNQKTRRSIGDSVLMRLKTLVQAPEVLFGFAPFPAYHLRPNAFMVEHAVLRKLHLFVVLNKMDTNALESSRRSITSQLLEMGLTSLIVDRSGVAYDPEQWDRSATFWQGDQEGLLVADNQTSFYTHGDFARRRLLSTFAWGLHSDPHTCGQSRRAA